jgi:translation initiation factor IF-2
MVLLKHCLIRSLNYLPEIQINIIHKGVGAITETDVMLASASDAIIIGFNVRPAGNARQLADKEEIDIRYYLLFMQQSMT